MGNPRAPCPLYETLIILHSGINSIMIIIYRKDQTLAVNLTVHCAPMLESLKLKRLVPDELVS